MTWQFLRSRVIYTFAFSVDFGPGEPILRVEFGIRVEFGEWRVEFGELRVELGVRNEELGIVGNDTGFLRRRVIYSSCKSRCRRGCGLPHQCAHWLAMTQFFYAAVSFIHLRFP